MSKQNFKKKNSIASNTKNCIADSNQKITDSSKDILNDSIDQNNKNVKIDGQFYCKINDANNDDEDEDDKEEKGNQETTPPKFLKKRGRPKKSNLTKEEYQKQYYRERYKIYKDEIKEKCAKNSKKYRDSYRLLIDIYNSNLLKDQNLIDQIREIIE